MTALETCGDESGLRENLTRTLMDLIRIRTENPPGDEYKVADYVEARLAPLGVKPMRYEAEPGRTNLLAEFGSGAPRILIACHSDTVPAGAGWSRDPFEPWESDGRVYGRGACDNKGQIAAALAALELMTAAREPMACTIILGIFADEERSSSLGITKALEQGLISADLAVVPDTGGNHGQIIVAEKGYLDLRITARGRQAHGSRPELGVNAIVLNSMLINRLKDHELAHEPHPFLSAPTINFGIISGGDAPNMVPARCELTLNIRYLPGQTAESISAEIRRLIGDIGDFGIEALDDQPPSEADPELPLIRGLADLAESVTGRKPALAGIGGVTVGKFLVLAGIPAVGFGPGGLEQAHTENESMAVADLMDFARIILALGMKGL